MSQGDAPGSDLPLIHSPSDRDCLKNLARNELKLYELLKVGKEALFSASGTSQPWSPDSLYLLFRQSHKSSSRKLGFRYTSLLLCLASRSSQGGRLKGAKDEYLPHRDTVGNRWL